MKLKGSEQKFIVANMVCLSTEPFWGYTEFKKKKNFSIMLCQTLSKAFSQT
jgi:hypothetical protein